MAVSQIAKRFLDEMQATERQELAERASLIAAGPPAGSGITAAAWSTWHRYRHLECPGERRELACGKLECKMGSACRVLAAKGLRGDGTPLNRKDRPSCGAKTRVGGFCAMKVEPGKHRCRLHGGLSTGPRTVEGKARIAAAQLKRWAWRRKTEVFPA